MAKRREHDLLGECDVSQDVYYGVHTLRAVENFPITGVPISIYPSLIEALALIKSAAAGANAELGLLDAAHRDALSPLATNCPWVGCSINLSLTSSKAAPAPRPT